MGLALDRAKECVIAAEAELARLDVEAVFSMGKRVAHLQELPGGDGKEPDLIEEAQQPWRVRLELRRCAMRIPHLHRAADELVSPRALHAVYTQISAADADRVFRGPRARGVVLGRDQPVSRIDRR